MNDDALNMSIRKFLKMVGINSQREIEQAVLRAIEEGRLQGDETLTVSMTLEVPALQVRTNFDGAIKLE